MTTSAGSSDIPLEKLDDAGLTLADSTQDVRGRNVIDSSNAAIGRVSALFIDPCERKVRMLEVHTGGVLGFGGHHVLIPIEAVIQVTADTVRVGHTRAHVAHSPAYNPEVIVPPERDYWSPYYGYYGYTPFWGAGYLDPHASQEANGGPRDAPSRK